MSDSNSSLTIQVGTQGTPQTVADVNRVATAIKNLSTMSPQQFRANMILGNQGNPFQKISDDADKATEHIGGMVYGMRSGMDAIRAAAAGGGTRAAFYAVDEAVRGLIASGLGLGVFVPVIAGISAVVGAGALVWHEYKSNLEDVGAEATALNNKVTTLAQTLKLIQAGNTAGLFGDKAANTLMGLVNGTVKQNVSIPITQAKGRISDTEYNNKLGAYHQNVLNNGTDVEEPSVTVTASPEERQQMVIDYLQRAGLVVIPKAEKGKQPTPELTTMGSSLLSANKLQEDLSAPMTGDMAELQKKRAEMLAQLNPLTALANAKTTDNTSSKALLAKMVAPLKAEVEKQYAAGVTAAQQKLSGTSDKGTNVGGKAIDEQVTAAKKLDDLIKQIHEDTMTGVNQEIAKIQDKYNAAHDTLVIGLEQSDSLKDDLRIQKALNELGLAENNEILKVKTAELERQLQIKLEMARSDAEAKLKQIEGNPFLSDQQKAQQSIPAIQSLMGANSADATEQHNIASNPATSDDARAAALEKINQLKTEQVGLDQKLAAAQGQNSFTYQLGIAVTHLQDMNNLAKETAQTFQNVLNSTISSVSNNLTKVIEGTETWKQALANISEEIIGSVIQGIVEMGVRWVLTQTMMSIAGNAISASSVAATAPIAAAQAAIWSGPATLSAIATFGASAAAAPEEILLAQLATLGIAGRATGGPVDADTPYWVGERGIPELFVPESAGDIMTMSQVSASARTRTSNNGGGGGGGDSETNIHQHFWDRRPHPKDYLATGEGVHQVLEIINRNRRKAGIKT